MANTAVATLQLNIVKVKSFLGYLKIFLRKKNPIKAMITQTTAYVKELFLVKKKLKTIENRINFEMYKLKKVELILSQNTEHAFLKKGKRLNQIR